MPVHQLRPKHKKRGKPFLKGGDPRQGGGRPPGLQNYVTRELKAVLLMAGENFGNRKVDEINMKLMDEHPDDYERWKRARDGIVSYFEWIAEFHPELYCALIGKILPSTLQHVSSQPHTIEGEVLHTIADVNEALKAEGLPPVRNVLQLKPRIKTIEHHHDDD